MDDDVLKRVLNQMSYDTQQLLDWEAQRLSQLRREAGIIDMTPATLDCEGHDHDDEAK